MSDFGIRFLLCNLILCAVISMFFFAKRLFRNYLTSRMQYQIWFLLLGLLAVPFLPFRPVGFSQIFMRLGLFRNAAPAHADDAAQTAAAIRASNTAASIQDFALSINGTASSLAGFIFCGIWLIGVLAMILLVIRSGIHFHTLKTSALPVQNRQIRALYHHCLDELNLKKEIPIYSTAYLRSPIMTGLFRPCIYIPIHLISDFQSDAASDSKPSFGARDLQYMLLHELQHYRHKDALAGCLMTLAGILYWFHPLVWYALSEMRNDREAACDASVLKLLKEHDYTDYGSTLIRFAEKLSRMPFPFTASISGSMKQMKKRIQTISAYQKPSVCKKRTSRAIFAAMAFLISGLAPWLSTYGAGQDRYHWDMSDQKISILDLSDCFEEYKGSFVLYNQAADAWSVYDLEHATARTAPDSTYKIYDALFGLEEGILAPDDSFLAWDGTDYPFAEWNADQDLYSAMRFSVNWYFQEIDRRLGTSKIKNYLCRVGYGNETIHAERTPFWVESSLKISPVEQVELLTKLCGSSSGFRLEYVNAVKDSICLVSSENGCFYGKTGTGSRDGQDINGWFIGFVETADNTCFFATNIQSTANASGSNAAKITASILADMQIWHGKTGA